MVSLPTNTHTHPTEDMAPPIKEHPRYWQRSRLIVTGAIGNIFCIVSIIAYWDQAPWVVELIAVSLFIPLFPNPLQSAVHFSRTHYNQDPSTNLFKHPAPPLRPILLRRPLLHPDLQEASPLLDHPDLRLRLLHHLLHPAHRRLPDRPSPVEFLCEFGGACCLVWFPFCPACLAGSSHSSFIHPSLFLSFAASLLVSLPPFSAPTLHPLIRTPPYCI